MGMSNVWWACDTIRQFSNEQRRCAALSRSTQTRSRCRRADPSLSLSPLSVSLSLSFPHLRLQVSLAHRGRRVVLQPPEGLLVREPEEGAGYYEGAGRQELWRRVLRRRARGGARALSQGKQQKIHKIVIIIEAGDAHARRIKSHFFYITKYAAEASSIIFLTHSPRLLVHTVKSRLQSFSFPSNQCYVPWPHHPNLLYPGSPRHISPRSDRDRL